MMITDIKQINIFGRGSHSNVVKNTIEFYSNYNCKVDCYDNNDFSNAEDGYWIIAVGDNLTRMRIFSKLKNKNFISVIHNQSFCDIIPGVGSQIMKAATIQCNVTIKDHTIINTSSSIDHDCKIGSFVHIAPNSTLCGNVSVGDGSFIGAGSVILPNIKIGNNSIVGAGSVVLNDIGDNKIYVGNPAREKK